MTPAAGFVGLGQIGAPMARRLCDWPGGLWVHDLDPEAVGALRDVGARVADSACRLGAQAGLISVMVRDDVQTRTVVRDLLREAHAGTVIAVHSTIGVDTARDLAEEADRRGVVVLDAPVSGGAPAAVAGRLAIMVGGTDAGFATARDYLARMGDLVVHVGPVGAGTAAKLARNLLHFVSFAAAGEAARLAEAAGVDPRIVGAVVRHSDAVTGGPGAIMRRASTEPVTPDDPWHAVLSHVRALGAKDLELGLVLADKVETEVPLARLAADRLGYELGLDDRPRERKEIR